MIGLPFPTGDVCAWCGQPVETTPGECSGAWRHVGGDRWCVNEGHRVRVTRELPAR